MIKRPSIKLILFTVIVIFISSFIGSANAKRYYYFQKMEGIINNPNQTYPFCSGEDCTYETSIDVSVAFSVPSINVSIDDNDVSIGFTVSGDDSASASISITSSDELIVENDSITTGASSANISHLSGAGSATLTLTASVDGSPVGSTTMTISVDNSYACNDSDPLSNIEKESGVYLIGGNIGDADDAKNQLLCLSQNQTAEVLEADYKLMSNVDFGTDETLVDWDGPNASNETEGWIPFGAVLTYSGNFNGNNKTVSNVYVNRPNSDYQGFFRRTHTGSAISNLGIVDAYIKGRLYSAALLSVASDNTVSVDECFATGEVYGTDKSGGLVGYSRGDIANSYSTATVSGASSVGGLVGYMNETATVTNSYATGAVTSSGSNIGSLIGESLTSAITKSYALNSSLTAVGSRTDSIDNYCSYDNDTNCKVIYEVGSIRDGWSDTIWYDLSSNTPKLEWEMLNDFTSPAPAQPEFVCDGTPLDDIQLVSGVYQIGNSADGSVVADSDLAQGQLLCLSNNQSASILSADYKLMADVDFGSNEGAVDWDGDGSADGIGTSGWTPISYYDNVNTSGNTYYSGVFDGNNKTINNLYINRPSGIYQGLFAEVNNGTVKDLSLTNVDVTSGLCASAVSSLLRNSAVVDGVNVTGSIAGADYVGGIACWARGTGSSSMATIKNSNINATLSGITQIGGALGQGSAYALIDNTTSTGAITGKSLLGGLVGKMLDNSVIQYSSATGNVTASSFGDADAFAGGLVGFAYVDTEIKYSYAEGNVSSSRNSGSTKWVSSGGLAGYARGIVSNCYATEPSALFPIW
jgi:hypothetical protein